MINNKFNDLYNLEITDDRIQSYFKSLGDNYIVKESPGYDYINYLENGISFCFRNKKLQCVYLYNDNIQGFKQYKESLPFNLNWKMHNTDIVHIFGDSKIKGGGPRASNIWIAYERLGIEFNFLNKAWEDLENPIIFISLFEKTATSFCNVCLNDISNLSKCDKCDILQYCSEKCKNIHISFHKKYCNN
jgi:hypothetical protein